MRGKAMTRLGPNRRSALGILADAPRGLTAALLAHYGIDPATLDTLVRDGLVRAQPETIIAGGTRSAVQRFKITDEGRRVLDAG